MSEASELNDRLLKTYGITIFDYEKLLKKQKGRCAICGYKPKEGGQRLHVDHDHDMPFGKESVRGLLCWICNGKLIGIMEKRKIPAAKLAEYLLKHNSVAK